MPEYTENYGLTLPLKTENYDLDHMTDSMKIIDTELKRVDDKTQEVEQDLTQHKLDYVEFSEDIQNRIDLIEEQVGEIKDDFESLENDYASYKDSTTLKVAKVEKELNDYKATMQQVNINQEPKQKATGYGVISLPPNAANGQAGASVKGRTLKNELNYNRDTWEEWTKSAGVITDSTGVLFKGGEGAQYISLAGNFKTDTKYGILLNVIATHPNITGSRFTLHSYESAFPTTNIPTNVGNQKVIVTSKSDFLGFNRLRISTSSALTAEENIKIANVRMFELPTGSEIENDFETMTADQLALKYPYISGDDTKSTISASRLKSVGKNKAPNKFNVGLWSGFPNPILNNNNVYRSLEPVKLKQGQSYTISGNNSDVRLFVYDKDGVSIISSGSPLPPKTFTPLYTGYFYISMRNSSVTPWNYGNPQDIALQLEEGTTATPYEPHTESNGYVVAKDGDKIAELRSLPNGTKDEIRASEGKLIKRVSDWITLDGSESGWSWSGAGTTNERAMLKISDAFPSGGVYSPDIYCYLVATTGWSDTKTGLALDSNQQIRIYRPLNDPNATLQDFRNWLGQNPIRLIYQLAEPVEIPVQVSGNLISYPSGTVYVEPFVADAGVYADKIEVLHQDLPIKAIEKVSKVDFMTGVETELDIEGIVIAENKLSFTHPDLSDGDIVFFEYEYDREGTTPETEIEYYDSRYTIKDSVTDKFYKWNVTVADGVPSIELVEV